MNLFKLSVILITILLSSDVVISQNGIQLSTEETSEGFALFETFFSSFLIDNCGD